MPTRSYPRREPRVMALLARRRRLAAAVVDATEIRSTGETAVARGALRLAITRLVLREKPTAIVAGPGLVRAARRVAARLRLPVVAVPARLIDVASMIVLYPEIALFATTALVSHATALAISTLLNSTFPSRTYAPRHPAPPRSRGRKIRGPRDADSPHQGATRVP